MIYSIWTNSCSDTYREIKNPYSEGPNSFQCILFSRTFTRHILTLIGIHETAIDNFETVVVNCYDVVPPTPFC